MVQQFDLFVVGGGSAGVRLGRIAAGYGARVGIAEGRFWGGTCVNIGCVPKKLMVMAAEYGGSFDDAAGFGWDANRHTHDWTRLIAAKDLETERLAEIYRHLLDRSGAVVFDDYARFSDPHTVEVGGEYVRADRIVIATGAVPTRLDVPGSEHAIVSDDLFYLPDRPERIVIIGSGYIAVEFASVFAGLGSHVDLVYRQPMPLRGFDPDLRSALAESMAANGIILHPSAQLARIESLPGNRRGLALTDGTQIDADCILMATGRAPNVARLCLERAGVAVTSSGAISINARYQTSVPHIFAIGDVTDRLNLTPVATAEGHALADTLFGGKARHVSLANVPTAIFSIPPVATVGVGEDMAPSGSRIFLTQFTPMRHSLSGRKHRRTMMKLVVDGDSDVVIGAHMMGEDAPEIVQGLAVAMTAGATKSDYDRTLGIHPTAAEEFVTLRTETRVVGGRSAGEE